MTDSVVRQDGMVYISIETLLGVLRMMRAMRDDLVEEDEENAVFIPGSEAAINFLSGVLQRARSEFIAQDDLTEEVQDMLGDINDFLGEQ